MGDWEKEEKGTGQKLLAGHAFSLRTDTLLQMQIVLPTNGYFCDLHAICLIKRTEWLHIGDTCLLSTSTILPFWDNHRRAELHLTSQICEYKPQEAGISATMPTHF
jgi:hypothetical protein